MDVNNVSGAILSGGMNLRFGGRNKAFSLVGGKTVLDRILGAFDGLFAQTLVVTNTPLAYLDRDFLTVADILPVKSALAGIHAALAYVRTPYVFVTACDMPFLSPMVIAFLLSEIRPRFDAIVPETGEGLQPLCAVYAKTCLPVIEKQLRAMDAQDPDRVKNRILDRELKITALFDKIRTHKIPESRLREKDPELLSFFNANTPEEFCQAEELLLRQDRLEKSR